MRRRNVVKAVVAGAVLALVIPGIAAAATSSTVRTPGSTAWNNPGAGAEKVTDADCTAGELASGGGVKVTGSGGMAANDIHLMGNPPSANGTSPATSTDTNVTHWLGIGGTGGNGTANYTVQPFVVCFSNSAITATQVVVASTSGPAGSPPAGATASTTATCTSGRLIGGGVRSERADNKSVKETASFPSDNTGKAAGGGTSNPTSWTVWTRNGGMGAPNPNTTTAYAICGTSAGALPAVTVQHTHAGSALTSGTQTITTGTACGANTTLVSGGASISGGDPTGLGGFTTSSSQGDHLIGDYPSDSMGGVPTNGTTEQNWTAIGETGGSGSTAYTDAWALCMA